MYHSIDFFYIDPLTNEAGSKINTYDDWGLVASSRPTIAPAKPTTTLVKIFGSSSFVNISESLTGYPTYESRTGSLEFIVLNHWNKPDAKRWIDIYNEVCEYLHGQELCCVLEDEPDYFYSGVFTVNEFASGEYNSTITIDYELQPYKYSRDWSDADWIWDTFNFETGIIPSGHFRNIIVTGTEAHTDTDLNGKIGQMPVTPEIIINSWTTEVPTISALKFVGYFMNKRGQVTKREAKVKRTEFVDNQENFVPVKLPLFVMQDECTSLEISVLTISSEGEGTDLTADISLNIHFREGRL